MVPHKRHTFCPIVMVCSLLIAAGLSTACHRDHTETIATYPNGEAKTIGHYQGNGDNRLLTGEDTYYPGGQLQSRKHYNHGQPTGTWTYYYPTGATFATATFSTQHPHGTQWHLQKPDGSPLLSTPYDSLTADAFTPSMNPSVLTLHKGDTHYVYEFHEDFSTRATGTLLQDQRIGTWTYYYPNGNTQAEATYLNGEIEGNYCTWRENGIPYFCGHYKQGKRVGIWEFYDTEGNLSGTKNFGE